jgi:hypothetical protein
MYTLAVLALLGLALFKLVDVIEDLLPGLTRVHALVTIALGIAGAFILDFSMTSGFQTAFRSDWMGTLVTGLAVAGVTSVWRAAFHWLGSNEGEEPEVRHQIPRRPKIAA